jgi:hypothetical protein
MGEKYGPSGVGSVVLQLGGDIGALILETGPDRLGAEIEISPVGGGVRTHSMVRERLVTPRSRYDAVYPDLPAGGYTVWHGDTPAATVEVRGGEITWHTLGDGSCTSGIRG